MNPETDKVEGGVSHHMSDIDYWKHPDRNYYVFLCLSVFFGFFGLDHFYLRSFGTGMQKALFNIVSFGFWYFWDLFQVIFESDKIKKEGLSTPFDWTRGIARGMFLKPLKEGEKPKIVYESKHDIVIYACLSLFTGLLGFNKFYIGRPWQGLAQIMTTFSFWTFFFGIAWAAWDAINVLFYTEKVLKDGVTVPPPYSLLFENTNAKDLFLPQKIDLEALEKEKEKKEKGEEKGEGKEGGWFSLPGADTFRFLYRELAVPLLRPTVGAALEKVEQGKRVTEKAVSVGTEVVQTVPKVVSTVSNQISAVANPDKLMTQIQAAATAAARARVAAAGEGLAGRAESASQGLAARVDAATPASAKTAAALVGQMGGGGGGEMPTSGPIIAGTLTAVLLAGAVKVVSELVSKQ